MEPLLIESTKFTPDIILDPQKGIFEISGRSLPEDVAAFYRPVLEWLSDYIDEPNDKTVFDFKLTYYNTASSKLLLDIMKRLEDIYLEAEKDVLIKWHFPEDDEDLEEAGEEYADIVDAPFESVSF